MLDYALCTIFLSTLATPADSQNPALIGKPLGSYSYSDGSSGDIYVSDDTTITVINYYNRGQGCQTFMAGPPKEGAWGHTDEDNTGVILPIAGVKRRRRQKRNFGLKNSVHRKHEPDFGSVKLAQQFNDSREAVYPTPDKGILRLGTQGLQLVSESSTTPMVITSSKAQRVQADPVPTANPSVTRPQTSTAAIKGRTSQRFTMSEAELRARTRRPSKARKRRPVKPVIEKGMEPVEVMEELPKTTGDKSFRITHERRPNTWVGTGVGSWIDSMNDANRQMTAQGILTFPKEVPDRPKEVFHRKNKEETRSRLINLGGPKGKVLSERPAVQVTGLSERISLQGVSEVLEREDAEPIEEQKQVQGQLEIVHARTRSQVDSGRQSENIQLGSDRAADEGLVSSKFIKPVMPSVLDKAFGISREQNQPSSTLNDQRNSDNRGLDIIESTNRKPDSDTTRNRGLDIIESTSSEEPESDTRRIPSVVQIGRPPPRMFEAERINDDGTVVVMLGGGEPVTLPPLRASKEVAVDLPEKLAELMGSKFDVAPSGDGIMFMLGGEDRQAAPSPQKTTSGVRSAASRQTTAVPTKAQETTVGLEVVETSKETRARQSSLLRNLGASQRTRQTTEQRTRQTTPQFQTRQSTDAPQTRQSTQAQTNPTTQPQTQRQTATTAATRRTTQVRTAAPARPTFVPMGDTTPDIPLVLFGREFDPPLSEGDRDVTLKLPDGYTLSDFEWIGMYDHCAKVRKGYVEVFNGFEAPTKISLPGLRGWVFGVESGNIEVMNCYDVILRNFTYIGSSNADAFIYVGRGRFPDEIADKQPVIVEGDTSRAPLDNFVGKDVVLNLPYSISEIGWIAVYNPEDNVSYGHTNVDRSLASGCEN